MEFAGSAFDIDGAMDVSGDVAQESAIASVIAEESGEAPRSESRVPSEAQSETDPAFEQAMARAEAPAAEAATAQKNADDVHQATSIHSRQDIQAYLGKFDAKDIAILKQNEFDTLSRKDTHNDVRVQKSEKLANSSQQSMTDKTASPAPDGDVENNKSIPQTEPVVNPSGEKKYSVATAKRARAKIKENEARAARQAAKTAQKSGEASKKAVESKAQEKGAEAKNKAEATEKKAQTDEQKISQSKEAQTDEQRAERAKARAEAWIEWEKNTRPTAKELNTAREYVKGFDNLSNPRRLAIIRMIRSAKGVDAKIVKGVANLMAIKAGADLEIRFDEKISNEGVTVPMGDKTLILIGTSTDFKKTIKGTIAHELVHYLERKPGYQAFAEHVMKHVKPEVRARVEAEVTKDYNEFYTDRYTEEFKKQGLSGKALDKAVKDKLASAEHKALIDSEVVAHIVGRALDNEKFLSRYARIGNNDGFIKRAYNFLRGMVKELRSKGEESEDARELADIIMPTIKSMDRLLQQGNANTSNFNKKYDLDENLGRQLQDWLENGGKKGKYFNGVYFDLGTTPNVFVKHGAAKTRIIMYDDVVAKVTGSKNDSSHNIPLEEIAKLPSQLNDPILLFKGNVPGSFIALTELVDKRGHDIVVAVHINRKDNRSTITKIASLYSKTNDEGKNKIISYVNKQIELGNLVDVSAKKAPIWFTTRGLQLPKVVQTLISASKHSIHQNEPVVNTSEKKYSLAKKNGRKKKTKETARKSATVASEYAGRYAGSFRLNSAERKKVVEELEGIENDFVKDGEGYTEKYQKRVRRIWDTIKTYGSFELISEDEKFREFSRYMFRKKFRVDKRFREEMGAEWKELYKALRGRIAADTNTKYSHIDTFYAELSEQFPDMFPEDIVNIHDQLDRIAKIIGESKNSPTSEFTYDQLPDEMQAAVNVDVIDMINSFVTKIASNRDVVNRLKKENEALVKRTLSMRNKLARERAENAKNEQARVFAKKDVKIAVDSIEG